MFSSRFHFVSAAAILATSAGPASAEFIVNLTTSGSSGIAQGALFQQVSPQPTGTGFIDPFLRIQQTGSERGYNTDARPVEFQTKDENQWTHSLQLSTLSPVVINGGAYYQFLLDINEQGSAGGSKLSMNDFRIYLGTRGDLTGWNDGFGANSVKVYDIDVGAQGPTTVELNYRLNSGSGSGDMIASIPVSYFQNHPGFGYVYLYSSFGDPHSSDAGFEEWTAKTGTPPPPPSGVPAPPGVVLAGVGMACCLFGRLRRKPLVPVA